MKILIAYDGSPDAKSAVALAGHLFDGDTAVILTVWEGFSEVVARGRAGFGAALDFEQVDEACEQRARDLAVDGAGRARAAGLQAETHVSKRGESIADTILEEADAVGADLIVVGSRGLGAVKSVVLGSVSRKLLHHAALPVLVAPAPDRCTTRQSDDTPFLSAHL